MSFLASVALLEVATHFMQLCTQMTVCVTFAHDGPGDTDDRKEYNYRRDSSSRVLQIAVLQMQVSECFLAMVSRHWHMTQKRLKSNLFKPWLPIKKCSYVNNLLCSFIDIIVVDAFSEPGGVQRSNFAEFCKKVNSNNFCLNIFKLLTSFGPLPSNTLRVNACALKISPVTFLIHHRPERRRPHGGG